MKEVSNAAAARGVTRLVHFTPGRNLVQIIDDGYLRTVDELLADPGAHFTATDRQRYDGHRDKTCCSIEYPNPYYLKQAQERPSAKPYPDWVALLLPVSLLDREGTLLSPRNAAAGTAIPASVDTFRMLYHEVVTGSRGRRYHRGASHIEAAPTDLQAEALVPDRIAVSQVDGLLFPTAGMLRDMRANLRRLRRTPPTHWTWRSSPESFDPNSLRRCIHGGNAPKEFDHV